MQYGEFIAQNRSIQHDKSCPIIGILIYQLVMFVAVSTNKSLGIP